ncbi:dienelactone hydrolase family protein [Ottowia sp.]|uniref:dienelactone hydrolase family protein n=1 Tax=Ottowia sp. TaxID=1898956 RepID=UPI002CBB007A|nr:dienelactone hydrolase family protein [Ottowia sp.]
MLKTDHLIDTRSLLDVAADRGAPSRRQALGLALGVGYAAATLPVLAQTAIKTSAEGLTAGEVTIDVAGFKMPAYRAQPAGKSGLPVVLVLSEIFGVHEYIADITRRLAHAGYLAIAPELFVRQGDAQGYGEMSKLMSEVIAKVPDAQVMGDLDATVAWAGAHGGNTDKLGVTGFCWGGRQVWLYAEHNPKLKAAVAWYGRLVGQPTALAPKNPLDGAAQLKAPVLGLYGGADTGIPLDTIDTMKKALAEAGAKGNAAAKASEFVIYPDSPHAFHADYRPSHRKEAAEDGWKRALAWFKAHGVA